MKQGICKLCLLDKPLCMSHLIPQAAYDYCRAPGANPLVTNADLIIESSRQVQHPLLCERCEDVLNKGGESWLVPLFAQYQGPFGFYDLLKTMQSDGTDDGYDAYAAIRNPEIKPDKLIHFALGMFWKASVYSWKGGAREPLIDLGPYREIARKFVRGEIPFPEQMALTIGVQRPPVKEIAFLAPYRSNETAYHRFYFYTSGMFWAFSVGKAVDAELRKASFSSNPVHPIIVGDFGSDVKHVFGEVLKTARRAANVEKYLKPRR